MWINIYQEKDKPIFRPGRYIHAEFNDAVAAKGMENPNKKVYVYHSTQYLDGNFES